MSRTWRVEEHGVTLSIDRVALGKALNAFAPAINAVAEEAAQSARAALPQESMRRFIGVKTGGQIVEGNRGLWGLKLAGRSYTGNRMMRGVVVPIALVTNSSSMAVVWEYGSIPKMEILRRRPKKGAARRRDGTTWGPEYFRQYQPLTIAGQRSRARFRKVPRA
jgi:hypothetical protein